MKFDGGIVRLAASLLLACGSSPASTAPGPCDPDDGGLALAEGFCARIVADDLGRVRDLVAAPNGDLFVTLRGEDELVLALRDEDGDGRADREHRFGRGDGHGIALTDTHLYVASHDRVLRWPWSAGQLEPKGESELIVQGFRRQRSHAPKSLALDGDGALFVSVGAPSNACQRESRTKGSPGLDPCPQLALQAGIWKYDADAAGQRHTPAARHATGLRHTLALAVHPETGGLFGAVNGRDQLGALWGYSDQANAELPAEELVHIEAGDDFGWPYCYYDGRREQKVLAPEYGGDGKRATRCAEKKDPALAFPAHWAPMSLLFYTGEQLPPEWRGGAYLAFRGSWNRAPLPQEGYRVVFVPFEDGRPAGGWRQLAIGAGSPTSVRFTGLAQGPDGSLYAVADANETIWRIRAE